MSNIVYIGTSLDGYIADINNGLNWLMDYPGLSGEDYGFADFMNRVDAIIMGSNTFNVIKDFEPWPYTKIVFVLSNNLKELPKKFEGKATIINGALGDIVKKLNSKGYINLYIDGGKTIQNFLKLDLIDELIITRAPIILGKGIPLFDIMDKTIKFKHIKTEVLDNVFVKSMYIKD